MHIGQFSEFSGYSQRMLRYLEDQGLLQPIRSNSNIRQFKDSDLTRVLKIKRLKELGFTYSEIKQLIDRDENALAEKGSELLKRHHEDANDLLDKIRRLEKICFGEVKTQSNHFQYKSSSKPNRSAYKIDMLNFISREIKKNYPGAHSNFSYWKFCEFLNESKLESKYELEIFEIFNGASVMAILNANLPVKKYLSIWQNQFLNFEANCLGEFPKKEMNEFFSKFEIVIEHAVRDESGKVLFHALLPYQAIFLASGQSA